MSTTLKKSSFCHFLLLSAAVVACTLQVALARPVMRRNVESRQFRFAIQTPFSGNFIHMTESGIIDTSRDYTQLSAQWYLRMDDNGFGFENCAFQGHYLVIASLGDAAILYGEDHLSPLTRRDVELLLVRDGSGSTLSTTSAGSLSPTTAASEEEFLVMSDWIIETTASLMTRFRTAASDRNCYLAVDGLGVPESNLCQIRGDSDSVVMKFLPILAN